MNDNESSHTSCFSLWIMNNLKIAPKEFNQLSKENSYSQEIKESRLLGWQNCLYVLTDNTNKK